MSATATRPYDSRGNHGPKMITVTWICALIALAVLCVRVISRAKIVCKFGWDDTVMCCAMLLSLIGSGLIIVEVQNGGGRHVADVAPDVYTQGLKINTFTMPVYAVAIAMVKVSVGFALMRIAGHTSWRYLIMTIMVIMSCWAFSSIFTISFQCDPPARRWDIDVEGKCWPQRVTQALSYLDATLNITTDVVFAVIIPVTLFLHLNVSAGRRIYLITVLGLGVFACIACLIKTIHLYQLANYDDWLWDSHSVTIWVVVEVNTGIVAGSIPAIKPLVVALVGNKSCGQDKQKRSTVFSLTTIGSHRRSWRMLSSSHRQVLVDSGVASGGVPSNLVVEDGLMYELGEFDSQSRRLKDTIGGDGTSSNTAGISEEKTTAAEGVVREIS